RKIDESNFVYDLLHRIRVLLQKTTLTVPPLSSQVAYEDPNAVAEYLDNTLSPESVAEFEKLCLESDIHLAEVAGCHQILSLVLGQPVEVDPLAREKMYEIPSRFPEVPYSFSFTQDIASAPPLPSSYINKMKQAAQKNKKLGHSLGSKSAIPEYLREPPNKYRWISIVSSVFAAGCLIFLSLRTLGVFDRGLSSDKTAPAAEAANQPTRLPAKQTQIGKATAKTKETPPKQQSANKTVVAEKKVKSESAADAVAEPVAPSAKPADAKQSPEASPASKTESPAAALKQPEALLQPGASDSKVEASGAPLPKAIASISFDKEPNSKLAALNVAEKGAAEKSESEAQVAEKPSISGEDRALPAGEHLGRFMSDEELLLKFHPTDNDWRLVAENQLLSGGAKLLALPLYRPEINLAAGINLSVLGGTELELLPGSSARAPGLNLHFGRIVMMPLANPGTRVRLVIGDRSGIVTFVGPDAAAAIKVRRVHSMGANPESDPGVMVAEMFVSAGQMLWDEQGQKTLEIAAPAQVRIEDQLLPEVSVAKELPAWISKNRLNPLDQGASELIVQELTSAPRERSARLGLMELSKHRRREVRLLAVRCLSYLDYFDPPIEDLDNVEYRLDWNNNIDLLRGAVGRNVQTAVAVRETLEKRHPQQAAELYRMLWGYSDKDLQAGEDAKLVKALENDDLIVRVLAFWNLKEITGKGLLYQPEQTAAKRQQSVQAWKERLKDNEIRVKSDLEKTSPTAGNSKKQRLE
ncbi:MAG: hypothetical protein ACWGMZ_00540, partial [Thermoguttaceae bacterium]